MKVKFSNGREAEISEEELEKLVADLRNSGYYISNTSYNFPADGGAYVGLPLSDSVFTEAITMLGNSKLIRSTLEDST